MITNKRFKVLRTVDNREDYQIFEELLIFNCFSLVGCFHTADGMNGDIPFNSLLDVQDKIDELEEKESFDKPIRNSSILLIIYFVVMLTLFLSNLWY